MSTILVTGATGTIGSQVVKALAGRGHTIRAAARGEDKAAKVRALGATPVDFEYTDASSIARAVEGVERLFLVTPFTADQVELAGRVVSAAKKAGVKHVVKLSAIGADVEPGIQLGRWHRAVEKEIEASGLSYTLLRPNNFFENFVNFYGPDAQGNIYLPWGSAKCSFIAGSDIARVAVNALTEDGHAGRAYELSGPEAIGIADAAETLSKVTGRKITYVDVPESAAKSAMLGLGMPGWMVDAMMELHAIDKAGYAAGVTDTVEKLTGQKARTFTDFAHENASKWR